MVTANREKTEQEAIAMNTLHKFRIRILVGLFLVPLFTISASAMGFGAQEPEHPDGVSIRQGSNSGPRAFFLSYGSRSFRGGGPHYGK